LILLGIEHIEKKKSKNYLREQGAELLPKSEINFFEKDNF